MDHQPAVKIRKEALRYITYNGSISVENKVDRISPINQTNEYEKKQKDVGQAEWDGVQGIELFQPPTDINLTPK